MPRLLEFLNWRWRYLKNEEKTKALCEQLQEVKSRLVRIVCEVRDRTKGVMAECVILVEQVVNGKILDEEHEEETPSAENEDDPTEVVETSDFANH